MSRTGDLLKSHRERLEKSQADFAADADISRGVISETESGELPKLTTIVQMRHGLKLNEAEWHRLLATYLVECRAVNAPDATRLIHSAAKFSDAVTTERVELLNLLSEALAEMPDDRLKTHLAFTDLLKRRPGFYAALSELIAMDRESPKVRKGTKGGNGAKRIPRKRTSNGGGDKGRKSRRKPNLAKTRTG